MTDKERIIIDGVDVSKCKHYERHSFYDCNETCEDNGAIVCTNCEDNPDCYFKQLTRKIQECEALKSKIHDLRQLRELDREARVQFYNQVCEYRKALKDIKEIVKINCEEICGRKFEDCNDFLCSSKNILNIINKAKEG